MMRELLEEYKQKGSKRKGGDREVGGEVGLRERTQEKTGDMTQNCTKANLNYYVICFVFSPPWKHKHTHMSLQREWMESRCKTSGQL